MNISEIPEERARRAPDAPCIADDTESLDNTAFRDRVRAAATVLESHGIGRGDVVAVILPNRVDLVVVLFAAWRLGAAVTPVNPGLTRAEVEHQLIDSAAAVVVGDRAASPEVTLDVTELAGGRATARSSAATPSCLGLLIYTSGTTGRPKGVMLDHANIAAMTGMIIEAVGLDETDHSLLILPLFHVNGIVVSVLSPLSAGGRTTVSGRFRAGEFFDRVEAVRPTYFSAVPAIYALLAALPGRGGTRHLVAAPGDLRRGPDVRRADRPVRDPLRGPDRGGLRPVGGHLRLHAQPADRAAQARHGRACRFPASRSPSWTPTAGWSSTDPARSWCADRT